MSNVVKLLQPENIKLILVTLLILKSLTSNGYVYDISSAQNESVMSYLVSDIEDETKYIVYIQSDGDRAHISNLACIKITYI